MSEQSRSRAKGVPALILFLSLLGLVLALQWSFRAYRSELGSHPDEASHYVTGLLFSVYLRVHPAGSPVEFARQFYAHYPKVAIGHWPPVFYIAQGLWSIAFSHSIRSILWLVAVIYALLGTIVALLARRSYGRVIAALAAVLFLAFPTVTQAATMIMADGLVSLLMVLAALTFWNFLEGTHRAWFSLAFGVLASLAILTKGSGIALAFVPPLMILLLRRWEVFRWPSLWIAPAVVMVLCGPWYWFTRNLQTGGWNPPVSRFRYPGFAISYYCKYVRYNLGLLGIVLAIAGLIIILASFRKRKTADGPGAAMVSLYLAAVAVAIVVPSGVEPRFLLPALVPIAYFIVVGACGFGRWVSQSIKFLHGYETACGAALIATTAVLCFSPYRKEFTGFSTVVQSITRNASHDFPSVLIVSDAEGEGMIVADMADLRTTVDSVTVRGTKLLADTSWAGPDYRLTCSSPAEVVSLLNAIPVNYVIDDRSVDPARVFPHQRMLQQAIVEYPGFFHLIGTLSVTRLGSFHPHSVYLYQFVHSQPPSNTMHISMARTPVPDVVVVVPGPNAVRQPPLP